MAVGTAVGDGAAAITVAVEGWDWEVNVGTAVISKIVGAVLVISGGVLES